MRRKWLLPSLAGSLALATGLVVFLSTQTRAEPARSSQSGQNDTASVKTLQLPIGQVVLFSSGVGYFQRQGDVEGSTRIDLSFPVQDINDLLKSMVVQDLGNGHVSAVSYDSQAPVEKTLRSFAVNLTNNPTFGNILNQARGERVEAVLQQATNQPGTLTGVVIGV